MPEESIIMTLFICFTDGDKTTLGLICQSEEEEEEEEEEEMLFRSFVQQEMLVFVVEVLSFIFS